MSDQVSGDKSFWKKFLGLAAILFLTAAVYAQSIYFEFTNWDDDHHVTENTSIRSLDWPHLKEIFTKPVMFTYVPLTVLSFALEYKFFGLNPAVYHFNNILLHLMVVSMVFLLGRRLNLNSLVVFLGTFIFALHPIHVESVVWVTERKDVLYAVFYLASVLFYLQFIHSGKNKTFYILSLGAAFLSILAKPMAYSLPLILLLLDWWEGRLIDRDIILEKIPFFLIIVLFSLITFGQNPHAIKYSLPEISLIWIWSFSFYLVKFVVPYPLIPVYGLPQPMAISNSAYLISLLVFILFTVLFIRFRHHRLWFFSCLFYVFSISFIVIRSVWDFGNVNIVADRFMYLPSVGFCFVMGALLDIFLKSFFEKGSVWHVFSLTVLLNVLMLLTVLTFYQIKIWKNSLTLWNHCIFYSPHEPIAYHNRGLYFKKEGGLSLALEDFNHAIELNSGYVEAYNNRGNVFALQGKTDSALRDYSKVLSLNPDFYVAYQNRGIVYFSLGQYEAALKEFTKVLEYAPAHETAQHYLQEISKRRKF